MPKSYKAEISGSQLIWIDKPPKNLKRQLVLVVIGDTSPQTITSPPYHFADLVGRLTLQGNATQLNWHDPIVQELQAVREKLVEKYHGNLHDYSLAATAYALALGFQFTSIKTQPNPPTVI
jgi:hypothetical protein